MQLLVLILNKTEFMPNLLSRLLEAGFGATVVACDGALSVVDESNIDPPPIFGALRQFLNPQGEHAKMMLTVLKEQDVERAKKIVDEAVGGLSKPNTGIMFTVLLSSVEGLGKA